MSKRYRRQIPINVHTICTSDYRELKYNQYHIIEPNKPANKQECTLLCGCLCPVCQLWYSENNITSIPLPPYKQ